MLPADGYTKVFESILDHERITVRLNVEFDRAMLADYAHCFNSMQQSALGCPRADCSAQGTQQAAAAGRLELE